MRDSVSKYRYKYILSIELSLKIFT